jgi:inorganic pyrophosphatase/exopolyphosphatase
MINDYLSGVVKINNPKKKTYILCTTACDMDSVVSALSLSIFKNILANVLTIQDDKVIINPDPECVYLPLINCYRGELKTRLDVTFVMKKFNIDSELFVYRNDMMVNEDLQENTSFILVDHNRLDTQELGVVDLVEEIYDHHDAKNIIPYTNLKSLNILYPLGSCCSLISLLYYITNSKVREQCDKLFSNLLLIAPILLDTDNFKPDYFGNRWIDTDLFVYNMMKLDGFDYSAFFQELSSSKYDEKANLELGIDNLMNKDKKVFKYGDMTVQWSSLQVPFKSLVFHFGWEKLIEFFDKFEIYICNSGHKNKDRKVVVIYRQKGVDGKQFMDNIGEGLKEKVLKYKVKFGKILIIETDNTVSRKICEPFIREYFIK